MAVMMEVQETIDAKLRVQRLEERTKGSGIGVFAAIRQLELCFCDLPQQQPAAAKRRIETRTDLWLGMERNGTNRRSMVRGSTIHWLALMGRMAKLNGLSSV